MNGGDEATAYAIASLNVGAARAERYKGKEQRSGIVKTAVYGPVKLGTSGLAGDEQADLVFHGGPDKAVCVYSLLHYPHWEQVLGRSLPHGSFGENFSVAGLSEDGVRIGDTFSAGDAVVQISQPRQPCWKLAMRWGLDELPALVAESGATGYYFRTLEGGDVRAGDELRLLARHPAGVTVAEANRVMHRDKEDEDGIRAVLAVDALSESWRQTLTKRLERLTDAR